MSLQKTYQQVLIQHNYPPVMKTLLEELLVATSLLTGEITVQLHGDSSLHLAVINGDETIGKICAGWRRVSTAKSPLTLPWRNGGNGYLVITLTPAEGERYQGWQV